VAEMGVGSQGNMRGGPVGCIGRRILDGVHRTLRRLCSVG
jgi:hypothetical protein